ncbi:SRPBCC family protein [Prauserella muralis]|uniref:Uncharacterized protein n=1 Tax=Prauserella muralis TaxID=588067 RepID=A0A2V4ATS8_9PSEU|nr:SRPBCC family protein [Prauserella muralis]PXY24652.1 hypothetical protein BAY60_19255 [Prauserella muralis]TWE27660.1 hypothetical protein FHX69_0303 [Prauserella muralis]
MRLAHSFVLRRPPAEVFDALLDVERVATCLPGAHISARSADGGYDGEVTVTLGPLTACYAATLHVLDADRERLRLTIRAKGRESRGAGDADAFVRTRLRAAEEGTLVEIDTELDVRGRVAQLGRGVLAETADDTVRAFAANLETLLAQGFPAAGEPAAAGAGLPEAAGDERHPSRAVRARYLPAAAAALAAVAAYLGARRLNSTRRRR